ADDPTTSLLVWTTTPWTLPSNSYAAVKPDLDYVTVQDGDHRLVMAAALREELARKLKRDLVVVETSKGKDWVGRQYRPPFDVYQSWGERQIALAAGGQTPAYFRVIGADFVSLDTGTGIVHIAPAFGEDDHGAHLRELEHYARPGDVELLCTIGPD